MSLTQLFSNNAKTTLAADITNVATTITVATGEGALFSSPAAGQFELITLESTTAVEIVKMTSRTTDTLTVVRGQEGTTGTAFTTGDKVEGRITKGTLVGLQQPFGSIDDQGDAKGANSINIQTARASTANVASGASSIAIGYDTKASAQNSVAISTTASAIGIGAIAIGTNSIASGLNSIALATSTASATNAVTIGNSATASAQNSVACGHSASATGTYSVSIGEAASGTTTDTISVGRAATSQSVSGIAIGSDSSVKTVPFWAANTVYAVGDLIKQPSSTPIFRCIDPGTSGGSEPTWNTTPSSTTTDNGVIWQYILDDTSVANADNSISIGASSAARNSTSISIGKSAHSLDGGLSVGNNTFSSSSSGTAVGESAYASPGVNTVLGYNSKARKPPAWTAGQTVTKGFLIVTSGNQLFVAHLFSSGDVVSGATEPTWPSNDGDTVVETGTGGTVTWLAVGVLNSTISSIVLGDRSSACNLHSVVVGQQAASGDDYSTTMGYDAVAGWGAVSLGAQSRSINDESVAIGNTAYVIGSDGFAGIAIGSNAQSLGTDSCNVIGSYSTNRINVTTVIGGMHLLRKDNGENASNEHYNYTSAKTVIASKEIDLKTLLDNASTITIPTGATFYPDELELIITSASGVTGNPDVSFGITGNTTSLQASTTITNVSLKDRTIFTPSSRAGVNSLTASVKAAATGTSLNGRFVWTGILVEDE